ncbi:MAG: TlpA family protein disulfide reductase [Acidobacteriota bacterium]|jgi:thiol-disulfide isomerase/thioredoxin
MTVAAAALALTLAVPAGDLRTPSGGPFNLSELLTPGPAVVVLWSSWLPGAQEFAAVLPEVEAAAARRGWRGVVVLFQDEPAEGLAKLPQRGLSWPRALDARGELLRQLKISRAPVVLLVNGQGAVEAQAGPAVSEVRALLASWERR